MKKILFIIVCLSGMTLIAQSPVDEIFNKYAGKDGYTTVVINSFMFKLMSNIETNDPDYEDFKKATSGIESIRILASDEGGANFAGELLDILPRQQYQEMMLVKEAEEEVAFLAREEGGKITEFLLIVDGNGNDDALIVFTGDIDLESIASLSGSMDLPAMESLEDFEK